MVHRGRLPDDVLTLLPQLEELVRRVLLDASSMTVEV